MICRGTGHGSNEGIRLFKSWFHRVAAGRVTGNHRWKTQSLLMAGIVAFHPHFCSRLHRFIFSGVKDFPCILPTIFGRFCIRKESIHRFVGIAEVIAQIFAADRFFLLKVKQSLDLSN